jgi:uncharacterized protein YeaO (DUF488 family)
MIAHGSIYDTTVGGSDGGVRVLVMRYWPRGVKRERVDVWLKDAAPSADLLKAYAHEGLAWSDFEPRYRAEILDERPAVLEQLRQLEHEHGTVTLLCHERQGHCHRKILLNLLDG